MDDNPTEINSSGEEMHSQFSEDINTRLIQENTKTDKNNKLIKFEQKYRPLVENSLQSIIIFQGLKIIFANSAASNTFGYTVEELHTFGPVQLRGLVHPDKRELVWRNLKKRSAGENIPPHYQFKCLTKDGKTKTLELYSNKIDYNNAPAVQAVCLDITERIEARKWMRKGFKTKV